MKRQARALSRMHRRVFLHVGKSEVGFAISSIGGSKEREQGRVLREREDLAVTERPALRGEVERKDANLSNERIHVFLLGLGGEDTEQRNDEVHTKIRLEVGVGLAAARRANRLGAGVDVGNVLDVELY